MARSKIIGSASADRKDVLDILTEDIEKHRRFIHFLYGGTALLGTAILGGGFILVTWFLGDRFEDSLLQNVVNRELREELDQRLSEEAQNITDVILKTVEDEVQKAQDDISSATNAARDQAISEINENASNDLLEVVANSIGAQLEELQQSSVEELAAAIELPSGLIAAFDLPTGCPIGWRDLGDEMRGRTIVGAVEDSNDRYGFRRIGGTEIHQLTIEEMPSHSHSYVRETEFGTKRRPSVSGQSGVTFVGTTNDQTRPVGGSQPHNNMPPYVSFFICRKE